MPFLSLVAYLACSFSELLQEMLKPLPQSLLNQAGHK